MEELLTRLSLYFFLTKGATATSKRARGENTTAGQSTEAQEKKESYSPITLPSPIITAPFKSGYPTNTAPITLQTQPEKDDDDDAFSPQKKLIPQTAKVCSRSLNLFMIAY